MRANRRKNRTQTSTGIWGPTDNLQLGLACIDAADTQPVRIRMLISLYDLNNPERTKRAKRIVQVFDLQPQHRQGVTNSGE